MESQTKRFFRGPYQVFSIYECSLEALRDELSQKGWAFITLKSSEEERTELDELIADFTKFFAKDEAFKNSFSAPFGFGYSSFEHKEGLRVLTGNRFRTDFMKAELVPKDLGTKMDEYFQTLDMNVAFIGAEMSECVFGLAAGDLARRADIPAAYANIRQFGMFDVAHYFNRKSGIPAPAVGTSIDDVNCVPHYDPGLLSLSLFSNMEGLQLLDPVSGKWIDGPVNTRPEEKDIMVMWLGEAGQAVTEGKLKAGIHRVVYPQESKSRLTLWYEMCTVKQVTEPDERYVHSERVKMPNIMGGAEIEVKKGEKMVNIFRKIERIHGIPFSKLMMPDDYFKEWDPQDYPES